MRFRIHITFLTTIVALAAAMASGGGVARFVHMMVAHGGHDGRHDGGYGRVTCSMHHAHAIQVGCALSDRCSSTSATSAESNSEVPTTQQPAVPHDDCAVCAELAVNLPTPELASPFDLTVEVLAIVHEREAALQPTLNAPRVLAARPPPELL